MTGAGEGVCHAVSDESWIQWMQESLPADHSSDRAEPLPQNIGSDAEKSLRNIKAFFN
jgi:hypothetical protein